MLTSKQKQILKGLSYPIKPAVFMGNSGVDPALLLALDRAFAREELIKVKLSGVCKVPKRDAAAQLAAAGQAELVNLIGRTVILYRKNTEKPEIQLP